MSSYQIYCSTCAEKFEDEWWLCPLCGGSLEISYVSPCRLPLSSPLQKSESAGNTSLRELPNISKELGTDVWAKLECENPTGSFKDRGSVVEVGKALELKKKGVVCASTGNMAISLSYYARESGLACQVVVPKDTPRTKLAKAESFGASLTLVDDNYDGCVAVAERIAKEEDFFLCGDYLLRREGQKTAGAEIPAGTFDTIIVPFGNGTLFAAIAKGLSERAGEAMPLFMAARPVTANTIASACNVRTPLDGALADSWMKFTGGSYIDVTDEQIEEAARKLKEKEGLVVEYSAAIALAGLEKLTAKGGVGERVLLVLTGDNI